MSSAFAADEEVVFSADGDEALNIFSGVVVDGEVAGVGVVRELFPAGQAVHDGFAEWTVWGGGIFSDERFPVVESLFDFGKDVDAVILSHAHAPATGVVIIQFFMIALFFRAFFGGE